MSAFRAKTLRQGWGWGENERRPVHRNEGEELDRSRLEIR